MRGLFCIDLVAKSILKEKPIAKKSDYSWPRLFTWGKTVLKCRE